MKQTLQINYETLDSIDALNETDAQLLRNARKTTGNAYAPYSNFNVAAVARLINGETIAGTNQENASYPVGICAERVLLAAISSLHQSAAIDTIAICYHNTNAGASNNKPASPCGMCRQALNEYQERTKHPIRFILSGMEGEVMILDNAGSLLPFSFGSSDMI